MIRANRILRILILVSIMLPTFGISCATADVAVQTSHVGAINVMAYHEETGTVVSGGDDGRIKVWDTEQERIIRSVQAGSGRIIALALHPDKPRLATISTHRDAGYLLQMWDMENGEESFSHTLEAEPLFLDFSPNGEFVFVAQSRSSGVRYFDEDSGQELDYPSVPQGIVTYATVASSGNTIMTYLVGEGEILYWNLSQNRVLAEAQTLVGLRNMHVLPNKRYAAATHDGDLVVVDIVEGSLMDRVPVEGAQYLTVSDSSGEIVLLETPDEGRRISVYEFDGERLAHIREHHNPALQEMNVLALAGSYLYGGTRSGELFVFESREDTERRVVEDVVDPITDIGVSGDTLYVNTDKRITAIYSNFLSSPEITLNDVDVVETADVENPIQGPVSFRTLNDGTLLMWGAEGDSASEVFRLEQGTGPTPQADESRVSAQFEQVLSLDSRVRSITQFEDNLIVLTRRNRILHLGRPNFDELMQYSALGIESAIGTERFGVVIGKTSTGDFDAAILTINPDTRETVPLNTEAFLVFDLVYDEETGNLYALGLKRQGGVHTTITRFSGSASLSRPDVLLDLPGEYLEGNMAIAPQGNGVYTSVGEVGIAHVTEKGGERYGGSTHTVKQLRNLGGRLWSLNRDGSASIWEPESGELLADLYMFDDGGWALLTEDGNFYSSSEQADEFIAAVSPEQPTEAFKLGLPE